MFIIKRFLFENTFVVALRYLFNRPKNVTKTWKKQFKPEEKLLKTFGNAVKQLVDV